MTIDHKALQAARDAVGTIPSAALWSAVETAIATYLAALPASDHAGLVEADAYADLKSQCIWLAETIKDRAGLQPVWFTREAATALSARVVSVKAIGPWRRGYCDEQVQIEQASFGGLYQVRTLNGVVNLDWPDRHPSEVFSTIEEAKAAAQADFERRILSALSDAPVVSNGLPQDVIDLVIAARIVAYEDQSPEALRVLDVSVEAFSERVLWDNDPAVLEASNDLS